MKRLYLMRHGHAPSPSEAGVRTDALRPLSDKGRHDVERMAAEILRLGGRPSLVLHSPLVRAAQTAQAAAAALKPASGAEPFSPLDNTRPPEEVVARLLERAEAVDEVLAVGHQPQLGEVAALLTRSLQEFRPGGVVAVELGPRPRLLWSANPDQLS